LFRAGDVAVGGGMTVRRTFASSVTGLVGAAVLAPSSHDTQLGPFRTSDSAIDLSADRTRALPVNDPDDRELTISCCALFNLRGWDSVRWQTTGRLWC
jgi:hypothetical protein